ncbi:hypothetical protein GQ44DRAFT_718969 [Phaeosphaeriaceae sp. PMI808]|nr:hypothetical protein GQ44DRAFT_718969 [Phaeosphaeriaceae sp. PMI808]
MPILHPFFSLDREIAQIEFNKTIAGCYRDGDAEYDSVGVLLLTWKDDDMNCKEKEVNALEKVFKEKFNFKTEQYEIPPMKSDELLFDRIQAFLRCYDCPSKLGIIYYGGHAERKETEEGVDLELFARRLPQCVVNNTSLSDMIIPESPTEIKGDIYTSQPHISFKMIRERIRRTETDILLIVDTCFAAGAYTDQPFGGRKCELFCSIAEKDLAPAPGREWSFTNILTASLIKMVEQFPEGFSTSDLYRQVYQQQHLARKPFHFSQSKFDFGKIWLRPFHQKPKDNLASVDSKYTIDVRFHLTKSLDLVQLNKVAKSLQYIPYVQMVKLQNMHSPNDDLRNFIRTVYLANRLRPLLARIRRQIELKKARQLFRTDSSLSSPSVATSERFHVQEPRDVGLYDWSKAQAITPHDERLTSDQYYQSKNTLFRKLSEFGLPIEVDDQDMVDPALCMSSWEAQPDKQTACNRTLLHHPNNGCLSQRTLEGLLCFTIGVLAPTVLGWAVHCAAA